MPTQQNAAQAVIDSYFAAFNAGDWARMVDMVTEDVVHFVNQGDRRQGKADFTAFLAEMDRAYTEQAEDLVIFANEDGSRAAAEFTIQGTYKASQDGLPAATGQSYRLPVGSFFTLDGGRIARVTTYYNLGDWMAQVAP